MKKEKSRQLPKRFLFIGTLILTLFFSIAFTALSINFSIKLNLVCVFTSTILLLVTALLFIHKREYTRAKFLIILVPPYSVFLISLLTKTDGILDNTLVYLAHRFFTLTYLLAPVVLFGLRRKKQMLLSLVFLLPAVVLFDFAHDFFEVKFSDLTFDPSYYSFFNFIVIFIYGFGIVNVLLYQQNTITFKRKIVSQSKEIKDQEKTLRQTLFNLNESIKHAKFIQSSLIPDQKTLNSVFKDISALFIPKDQVSGDFYFTHKHKTGPVTYFGIGDCTGHGVPGAFIANMSIQSIFLLLNRQQAPIMPDVLLTELRKTALDRVVNVETNLSDSMDAGICLYDGENSVLYFSGGFINLFLLRNNKDLIEYKGVKCPIGLYPVELPYELHSIKIQKNDIIYLTSDGYYDQFGTDEELKNKNVTKFKKKRFKDFIISISHLSSQEQTRLLEDRFYSWKGDEEQTDDVTVLINKF